MNKSICEHMNFYVQANINRLTSDDDGPVENYHAEISVKCNQCGMPFRFLNMPVGYDSLKATTDLTGLELRAPIAPGALNMN